MKPMLRKQISGKLKQGRMEKGLTQKEVAKQLNVNRSLISCYETGKTLPSITNLYKLSLILKKDMAFFFKD